MPPPARSPSPPPLEPIPDDPADYVLFAVLHPERGLSTLPGLKNEDFDMLKTAVSDAVYHKREEVLEHVRLCLGIKGDEDALIQAILSI